MQRDLLQDSLELSFLMRKKREQYILGLELENESLKEKVKKLKKKNKKLKKKGKNGRK